MKYWIAARETSPGMPKKPDIETVPMFIGIWISYEVPIAFKKKRSKAPIHKRIIPCPIHRNGFSGAPTKSSNKIKLPRMDTTINGSIALHPPITRLFNLMYGRCPKKRTKSHVRRFCSKDYFNDFIDTFLFFASFNKKKYFASVNANS